MGRAVLQYSHCTSDTTHRRARGQKREARWARGTGTGRAAWACCWPTGYALGALILFLTRFDSVPFLSQFLDIVIEPGS